MNCDECLNLLSAQLDNELPADDLARAGDSLNAHLVECENCRAMRDVMVAEHANLSQAMQGRRAAAAELAERVTRQLELTIHQTMPLAIPRRWYAAGWVPFASAAAGFVLAVLCLQIGSRLAPVLTNFTHPTPATVPSANPLVNPAVVNPPVAQLALATGKVFICTSSADQWSAMPTGGEVQAGDRVRTEAGVRCEFKTIDGSEVRLNASTEVRFRSSRALELAGGQLWSTVSKAIEPFQARTTDATFTALGTQFDLAVKQHDVVLTVVEGSVQAKASGGEKVVKGGEGLTLSEGRLGEKKTIHDLAVATRWVNEILVMKGRDNPELAGRVDDLFAHIGQQKMAYLYEDEIRALGDHCVIPLARFVESDRSKSNPIKRAEATRILADVAPTWAIPELIKLLGDRSGEVRFYAAGALQRLTGQTLGRAPEQWRVDDQMTCMPVARDWRDWWESHKDRFPGADQGPLQVPEVEKPLAKDPVPASKG